MITTSWSEREPDAEVRGQRSEVTESRVHGMIIRSAKELEVYRKAYELAMRIFHVSKRFPAEEKYALTSQARRSSRSVCMCLREAWAKRRYEAHFVSKLTDCDGENSETDTSLNFAKDCGYISAAEHENLSSLCAEVGKMLGAMVQNPAPFLIHSPNCRD
jgi:four helix bundle protein